MRHISDMSGLRGLSVAAGSRQSVAAAVLLMHTLLGALLLGLAPSAALTVSQFRAPRAASVQAESVLVYVSLARWREPSAAPQSAAVSPGVQTHRTAPVASVPARAEVTAAPRASESPTAAALPGAASAVGAADSATTRATTVLVHDLAPSSPTAASPPSSPAPPAPPPPTVALQQARPDHDNCPPAPYPALLRERGIEGVVRVQVRINPEGRAAQARVVGGSGWRLFDEAALQRALACRFIPARRGDEAVEGWVDFPVRFTLLG